MQDELVDAEDALIRALRMEMIDFIDECIAFAEEVEESEIECGCMSIITIQQHLGALRARRRDLVRAGA